MLIYYRGYRIGSEFYRSWLFPHCRLAAAKIQNSHSKGGTRKRVYPGDGFAELRARQKGDDNYFAAPQKLAGISKDGFNTAMWQLINAK